MGGGRDALLACGRPYVGHLRGPLLAYHLDVEKRRVAFEPGRRRARSSAPARATGRRIEPGRGGGSRDARTVARWELWLRCSYVPGRAPELVIAHPPPSSPALAVLGGGRDRRGPRPARRASSPGPPAHRAGAAPTRSTSSGSPTGLQPPDVGRCRARRPGALWVLEQPGPGDPAARRAPRGPARPLARGPARRRAGPAGHRLPPGLRDDRPFLPALVRPPRRHARRRVPRRTRSCASCSSSISPRRTTTAASSRSGPTGGCISASGDGGGAFDPERARAGPARAARQAAVRRRRRAPASRDWRVELTGLRNPWRFSFDPALGEIWIGDVGQDEVEEVNRVLLEPDEPPKNLGWDAFEGDRRTGEDDFALDTAGRARLARGHLRPHEDGCSVIGGYVYQGVALPRPVGPLPLRRLLLGHAVVAEGGARTAARPTSAASARRCRSSPTSARTPTASRCSPRATARSTARSAPVGLERADRPVDPHPHAVAGMPRREAEPAAAQPRTRSAARAAGAGRGQRTSAPRRPLRCVPGGAEPTPIAIDSGRSTTSTSPASSARSAEAAELALDDAAVRRAGQHVGLAEELRQPAGARALVDLLGRADLLDAARRA